MISRLVPELAMLAEELTNLGIAVRLSGRGESTCWGIRRYTGQTPRRELLYLISVGDEDTFPIHNEPYVTTAPIHGRADHLTISGLSSEQALDLLEQIFFELQDAERRIWQLPGQESTLDDLCALGEELFGNPVLVHDSWFMILARSQGAADYLPLSGQPWEQIPQEVLDDFSTDPEYQETYHRQGAQLWPDVYAGLVPYHTIYVNLYEKEAYQGRLLIMGILRPLRRRDYGLAELLARQALLLLHMQGERSAQNRSIDAILLDILHGTYTNTAEYSALLRMLRWSAEDWFLCIRLGHQDAIPPDVSTVMLRRELLLAFPGSYLISQKERYCVVVNLSRTACSAADLQRTLSPLCRDFCQYAGLSSPVEGISALPAAYLQAEAALTQAFHRRDANWTVPFSACALDYLLAHLNTSMEPRQLAAPQLLELQRYDQVHGTQYFETLRVYLLCEREIPRTAAALIIHRTTLTYRLQKLRGLLRMNLDEPDVRLYLLLSLRLLGASMEV